MLALTIHASRSFVWTRRASSCCGRLVAPCRQRLEQWPRRTTSTSEPVPAISSLPLSLVASGDSRRSPLGAPKIDFVSFVCRLLRNGYSHASQVRLGHYTLEQQRQLICVHAGNALAAVSLIFAADIFMGVLPGTDMVGAMATSVIGALPNGIEPYMAPVTALLSIPFTFLISNDASYFGMLPVLAQTAHAYGISPQEIVCASLIGQQVHLFSPLVPSTYLLVGMSGIEFGSHQRFTLPWALTSSLVLLATSMLLRIFPLAP